MRLARGSRLELAAKLRQAGLQEPVSRVRRGGQLAAPLVVEFDLTTYCDLGCPECISGELLRTTAFTATRVLELVDEMADAGVRAMILIGGGEPLIHPRASDVMRRARARGITVGLTTNGTQIHRHLDAIAEAVAWTRVSVDAATSETYSRFRPARGGRSSMFENVIRNMRDLAARKSGSLGYSFLLIVRRDAEQRVVAHNLNEVTAAAELARDVGCDYFEVKPEYDMEHYLKAQSASMKSLLDEQLRRARDLEAPGFSVIAPAHLAAVVDGAELAQPKSYTRCPMTELRTLVTPSGVYACPYHRGRAQASLGDARGQAFGDLWTSSAATEGRAVDPSCDCGFNCIRHESNLFILNAASSAETVPDYDPFI